MPDLIMTLQGTTARLELYSDRVVISASGALGKMAQKGDKTIYLRDLTGVQFKKATALSAGYLHFTMPGGREKLSGVLGASANENSLLFPKKENEAAEQIKDRIEQLIASAGEQPAASGADEILKYKSLLDQGVITQEEFEKMKQQLLGL